MSDFAPIKIGFDVNGYMKEFIQCLNIALDRLSINVQTVMKNEIYQNGNGSLEMKGIAVKNVHEISRKVTDHDVELIVGIDESTLGSFSDRNFVATMVVLHGNVAHGPLMTKPGKMTWTKSVRRYRLSPPTNQDGTKRKPKMMPEGFMQFEKIDGFGEDRKMIENMFKDDGLLSKHLKDFQDRLEDLMNSIDYSKYVTGG